MQCYAGPGFRPFSIWRALLIEACSTMAKRAGPADVTHEEVLRTKKKCNKAVDDNFSLHDHCTEQLAAFLSPLVAASCQHAFATMSQLAAGFGNVTNGAKIDMWNTGTTPLSTIQFYVGDSQQGKSRLAAFNAAVIGKTDEQVQDLVRKFLINLQLPGGVEKPESVTVRSTGLMDFTVTEFLARGSGDWPMVKEFPDHSKALKALGPRPWMSLTANVDEGYPFMQAFGWMQEAKGSNQTGTCPSQNASKLNTLIGTGKIQRDTKTSGNFGGSQVGSVNVQVIGNVHWLMLMHLERGSFGCDVQQAKARAVYVAGSASKRHAELPSDFILPESVPSRWTWLPLTPRLATAFGWAKFHQKPDVAATDLAECTPEENFEAGKPGYHYIGPCGGYKVELRDGVTVRLRFSTDPDGVLCTEYRISSRWKLPSPIKRLLDAVTQVFDYFKDKPHHVVPFEDPSIWQAIFTLFYHPLHPHP